MFKRLLVKIRYPKLILLAISIFVGYLIYTDYYEYVVIILENTGYIGTFLAGMFFVYGFTAGPAAAVLLISPNVQNFWLAGIAATAGSILGNLIVFKALKISLENEMEHLAHNKFFKWINSRIKRHTPFFIRKYIFPALAGFISATPLPDEFVIALVSNSKDISFRVFSAFAFFFSFFGIFVLLWIGKML
jgi:hypothetical protein